MSDLQKLLSEAVAKYKAMSPADKALLNYEQRRSFVRGQIGLSYPDRTNDEINKSMDAAEIEMGIVKP